jgi:hypothetical protein
MGSALHATIHAIGGFRSIAASLQSAARAHTQQHAEQYASAYYEYTDQDDYRLYRIEAFLVLHCITSSSRPNEKRGNRRKVTKARPDAQSEVAARKRFCG